jgi:uncharacterized protein with PQ loop repeat
MILTYKRKTTKDISASFLVLRIIGNSIWIAYAIEVNSFLMLVNNCITVLSSFFVGYFKILELRKENDKENDKELIINEEL